MVAQALFANGGFKVREGGTTVGFLWVEPVPGTPGEQLQRWVLTRILGPEGQGTASSFTFERWGEDMVLKDWESAVQKQIPKDLPNAQWGENPANDGLWSGSDFSVYIVAQSKEVRPRIVNGAFAFSAVEPTYPRGDAGATTLTPMQQPAQAPGQLAAGPQMANANRAGGAAPKGLTKISNQPPEPKLPWWAPRQIVIPLLGIHQWQLDLQVPAKRMGICGGSIHIGGNHTYFKGEEVFFLEPEWQPVGAGGLGTRWDKNAALEETIDKLSGTHAYIHANWKEGCRYEVTGCNYYMGAAPPPAEFV